MQSRSRNAYPRLSRPLRAIAAVVALGLLANACTATDHPDPSKVVREASVPVNSPDAAVVTKETIALNNEVRVAAMCLASKVIDLSREKNNHPGMMISEDVVGTEASININIPTVLALTGEPIPAFLSASMGIGSNGNGDPAKVRDVSVVLYGTQDPNTQKQAEPLSLVSLVQVVDGSGWNVFIRSRGQTEGGIYVTLPTDGSNPNVQNLTTDILQAGTLKANAHIDVILQGAPPACA